MLNGSKWLPLGEFGGEVNYVDIGDEVKNETDPRGFQKFNELMDKYLEDPLAVY